MMMDLEIFKTSLVLIFSHRLIHAKIDHLKYIDFRAFLL